MSYHDVNLHLTLQSGVIHVYAADEGGSRVSGEASLEVSGDDVRRIAEALEADRLRDFEPVLPTESARNVESLLEDLGRRLSEALLPTRVSWRWASICGHAVHPRKPVRLRLDFDLSGAGADLHAIPWECALDPQHRGYLALRQGLSMVRLVARDGSDEPPPRPDRLKILAVAPSCPELAPLSVQRELEQLRAAIDGKRVDLEVLDPPTLGALQTRLDDDDVHVVHYLGHGFLDAETGEGAICLQGEGRRSHRVSGRRFAETLQDRKSLRLLFLNACRTAEVARDAPFAGVATAAIEQAGIPAVIAMQFPIRDSACVRFAAEIYGALSAVDDLDQAVIRGRRSLRASSRPGEAHSWMIPVLFSRLGGCQLFAGRADGGWAGTVLGQAWRRAAGLAVPALLSLAVAAGGWLWLGSRLVPPQPLVAPSGASQAVPSEADPEPEMDPTALPTARDEVASWREELRPERPAAGGAPRGATPEDGTGRPEQPPPLRSLTEDRPLYFADLDATLSLQLNRQGSQSFATLHLALPGESIPNQAVLAAKTVRFETSRGALELDVVRIDDHWEEIDVLPLRTASR